MKKLLQIMTVLIFCCCITVSAYAESPLLPEDGYDVRKTRWGMSLEVITQSETVPMFGKPEYTEYLNTTTMRYRDQILGIWCDIFYEYEPQKGLYSVHIYFVPQSKQISDNLFDKIANILKIKYENHDNLFNEKYRTSIKFSDNRTIIKLGKDSVGLSKAVEIHYYSMEYCNEINENKKRREIERKKNASLISKENIEYTIELNRIAKEQINNKSKIILSLSVFAIITSLFKLIFKIDVYKIILSYFIRNKHDDNKESFGVRNTTWNITKEQIKKIETSSHTVDDSKDCLKYSIDINNINGYIMYFFENNKLYEIIYFMKPKSKQEAEQLHSIMQIEIDKKYSEFKTKKQRTYSTPDMDIEIKNDYDDNNVIFLAYTKKLTGK